jgi:adenylate cyclase
MERRLAAILAADVAGYSHLTELNEEASTATLRVYGSVVEESIVAHRGPVKADFRSPSKRPSLFCPLTT